MARKAKPKLTRRINYIHANNIRYFFTRNEPTKENLQKVADNYGVKIPTILSILKNKTYIKDNMTKKYKPNKRINEQMAINILSIRDEYNFTVKQLQEYILEEYGREFSYHSLYNLIKGRSFKNLFN